MNNILISGSCVSRDALEFLDPDSFNLIAYHARSSLCSLVSKDTFIDSYKTKLTNISSTFQRRMVENDFSKGLLKSLEKDNFDLILMDLIDERFHIAMLDTGQYVTRSTEFLKSEISPVSLINNHSDNFFDLWCKGVDIFINKLRNLGCIDKLIVQKAYWSNTLDTGMKIPSVSEETILAENTKLDKMYKYLSKYLSSNQFLDFPSELLVIKSDHKWGVSPFHFIDDYYIYLNNSLGFK